eukprot:UN26162
MKANNVSSNLLTQVSYCFIFTQLSYILTGIRTSKSSSSVQGVRALESTSNAARSCCCLWAFRQSSLQTNIFFPFYSTLFSFGVYRKNKKHMQLQYTFLVYNLFED